MIAKHKLRGVGHTRIGPPPIRILLPSALKTQRAAPRGRRAGNAGAEKQSGKVAVKRDPNGNGGTEAPTPRIEECLWFSYELRIHGQANPLSFVVDSIFLAIDPTIYAHRNRVVATAL